jgi:hypothetical protein
MVAAAVCLLTSDLFGFGVGALHLLAICPRHVRFFLAKNENTPLFHILIYIQRVGSRDVGV